MLDGFIILMEGAFGCTVIKTPGPIEFTIKGMSAAGDIFVRYKRCCACSYAAYTGPGLEDDENIVELIINTTAVLDENQTIL